MDPDSITLYFRAYDLDNDGQMDLSEYTTAAEMIADLLQYESLPG